MARRLPLSSIPNRCATVDRTADAGRVATGVPAPLRVGPHRASGRGPSVDVAGHPAPACCPRPGCRRRGSRSHRPAICPGPDRRSAWSRRADTWRRRVWCRSDRPWGILTRPEGGEKPSPRRPRHPDPARPAARTDRCRSGSSGSCCGSRARRRNAGANIHHDGRRGGASSTAPNIDPVAGRRSRLRTAAHP